jgi:DUF917 family protein
MRSLDSKEVEDLIVGAAILGTGGGGDPQRGLELLREDLAQERRLSLASESDLEPESTVVCAYHCGSIPSPGKETSGKHAQGLLSDEDVMLKGLQAMEKRLGKRVRGVIPTEIGGGNTPAALHLAALLGVPSIDADQVGRAAPELVQSSYLVNGVEATPSVVVDAYGDVTVVEHYANPAQYEMLVRSLAVAAGGSAFVIDSPISAARAFAAGIKGTVSGAISLGGVVRESLARGDNPVSAVAHFLNAFTLFQGEVSEFALKEEAGFLVGEIWIDGRKEWSNRRLRVSVKNENMVAWLDDKPVAMIPDSICLVDESGYGVTNSAVRKKLKVSVLGVASPSIWRTQKGLDHFGPRRLGFAFDYIPIEELQKHR